MRPLLGTFVEVRAMGESLMLEPAIAAAFADIERVQRLMSFHDPDSDVSRINAAHPGEILRVDAITHSVLRAAQSLSDLSDGLFDIATAATLVRQGFLPRVGRFDALPRRATYRDLELLPQNHIRWRRKGWIDLGGIAKGFAVDQAVEALRTHGISSGIVNAGGDLRCFGEPQPIHLRTPHNPAALLYLGTLANAAIATSADYFTSRKIGADEVSALVDPRRAQCVAWEHSVSVVAADCMIADALTKVVCLIPQRAPALLEQLNAQAFLVNHQAIQVCGRQWLDPSSAGGVIAA
jgi:thiamine biosynthesis lipoprotein